MLQTLRSVDQLYFFLLIKLLFILQFKTVLPELQLLFLQFAQN